MKIVLMADNRKNELLVNFCTAYKTILMKHQIITIYSTSKLLKTTVGLDVSGLSVDYSSGIEQLASRLSFNEIDAFIYLRDGRADNHEQVAEIFAVCDIHNIPCATNLATAELLVLAIDRGALDYRQWLREGKN